MTDRDRPDAEGREYQPAVCPWCAEILLDTPLEHLRLRVELFIEHAAGCPSRPAVERPQGGYGAGIARIVRGAA